MGCWFVGEQDAAVEGEGNLDLCFVGDAGYGCGALGEGHFSSSFLDYSFLRCCL